MDNQSPSETEPEETESARDHEPISQHTRRSLASHAFPTRDVFINHDRSIAS